MASRGSQSGNNLIERSDRATSDRPERVGAAEAPAETTIGTTSGTILALAGVLLSTLFLMNLTFGLIEIPDNLPIVGNLDEVAASALLFASLARLGIHLPFEPKRHRS